jgi:hypothetical protein
MAQSAQAQTDLLRSQNKMTLVVAVGSIVLSLIALVVSIWTAIIAIKTATDELRAYVFVVGATLYCVTKEGISFDPPRPIVSGGRPCSKLEIRNTGQTPAFDVRVYGKMDIVQWPVDATTLTALPFDDPKTSRFSLGSNVPTWKGDTLKDDRLILPPEMRGILAGSHALVVHGEIRYRDAFGKRRWTKYRFFVGGAYGIQALGMGQHEDGNEST